MYNLLLIVVLLCGKGMLAYVKKDVISFKFCLQSDETLY